MPAEPISSRRKLSRSSATSAGWMSSSLILQDVFAAQRPEQRDVPRELCGEDPGLLVAPQGQLAARAAEAGGVDDRGERARLEALDLGSRVGVGVEDAAAAAEADAVFPA